MPDRDWFRCDRLPHGVTRISEPGLGPLHAANLWLVEGRERALLIDTGVGVRPLQPVVASLTSRPVICLVTHAHYDHMGGAWEFEDRRAHPDEAVALADPTPGRTLWQGWLTDDAFLRRPEPGFTMAAYRLRPAPPAAEVDDGAVIDLGDRRVEVLHVPGHSPGLLAVHDPGQGLLFTSDALYAGRMFFDIPGADPADAGRSIARLMSLGARMVHPGHGESLDRVASSRVAAAALRSLSRAAGHRGAPAHPPAPPARPPRGAAG